ncbi:hypothetical protein MCOR25_000554 [Pyricularia grisea]|nr:hypothetical protein MCOR25_000554 [Pyricularia grisea]
MRRRQLLRSRARRPLRAASTTCGGTLRSSCPKASRRTRTVRQIPTTSPGAGTIPQTSPSTSARRLWSPSKRQESSVLTVRGRKISLQYTDGSPCGEETKSKDKLRRRSGSSHDKRGSVHSGASHSSYDDESRTRAAEKDKEKEANKKRRKSATFSFICDHEMMGEKAVVSYIGSTPDECAYFFDVRSSHACAGVEPHKPGSVGPGGVFAIIFFIAVGVYVGGGVFYQRTVAHARGWRQLPNYSLWAGIWNFISDFFIIATSSCARCIPGRRGYRTLSSSPSGRGRNREDENRLIDQLDEEWDD